MKSLTLDLPEFGFVVGTRVALAFGLGLLASSRIQGPQRRAIGLALVGIGVAATVPAAMSVMRGLGRANRSAIAHGAPVFDSDETLMSSR